jgi:hypothetical protein
VDRRPSVVSACLGLVVVEDSLMMCKRQPRFSEMDAGQGRQS